MPWYRNTRTGAVQSFDSKPSDNDWTIVDVKADPTDPYSGMGSNLPTNSFSGDPTTFDSSMFDWGTVNGNPHPTTPTTPIYKDPLDPADNDKWYNEIAKGVKGAYDPAAQQGFFNRGQADSQRMYGQIAKNFGREYEGFSGQPEMRSFLEAQMPAIQHQSNVMGEYGDRVTKGNRELWDKLFGIYGHEADKKFQKLLADTQVEGAVRAAEAGKQGTGGQIASTLIGSATQLKIYFACVPSYFELDTPTGSVSVGKIKCGDVVFDAHGTETEVLQKHEYKEEKTTDRFIVFTFATPLGLCTVTLCDKHRMNGRRAEEYNIGDVIFNSVITRKEFVEYEGVSYDILTKTGTYRSHGIPVNSMIVELATYTTAMLNVFVNGE